MTTENDTPHPNYIRNAVRFLPCFAGLVFMRLSLQATVVCVELKTSIEKNGHLYGVLESNNSRAKQLGKSPSDHFYIEIPQNTSAGVLQSSRVAMIIALFCPLRIIQCKYMVRLREKLGPRSTCNRLGTNLKSRPWIERLH